MQSPHSSAYAKRWRSSSGSNRGLARSAERGHGTARTRFPLLETSQQKSWSVMVELMMYELVSLTLLREAMYEPAETRVSVQRGRLSWPQP